ncbi:VOC family protein [Demequina sp.]|uniref:VOC family protein n=1 Tax=Demequina sp. TaxID=2050685 RepID=UPI003A85D483
MFASSPAFGSFSTDSVARAAEFYGEVLGIDATVDNEMGPLLTLTFPNGARFMVYEKADHVPATHTVLNLPVIDLDKARRQLADGGVQLERLEWTDDNGVAQGGEGGGPRMAWIKDPAGNWIAILELDD